MWLVDGKGRVAIVNRSVDIQKMGGKGPQTVRKMKLNFGFLGWSALYVMTQQPTNCSFSFCGDLSIFFGVTPHPQRFLEVSKQKVRGNHRPIRPFYPRNIELMAQNGASLHFQRDSQE